MRLVLALAMTLTAACAAWQEPNPDSVILPESDDDAEEPLSKYDVLEVEVFREKELGGVYRVGHDGQVELPLIGKLTVEGLLPEQIKQLIEQTYADGFLKSPQVFCRVKKYNAHKIYVLGQVRKPGTFPFTRGMDILTAISKAGGFTALSATNSVTITRQVDGVDQRIVAAAGDIGKGAAPNFEVRPGDIIYVPESLF